MFDRLRDLTAEARGRVYSFLVPLQVLLAAFGLVDGNAGAMWAAAIAAVLGFTLAGANSTATWRTYLYGLLAAAQPILVSFGVFTDSKAAAIVAVVSAALGLTVAAAKTPHLG